MVTAKQSTRIAGIDYGTVRVGVAVTNADRTLASPYENYTRRSTDSDAQYFRQFVASESIGLFVVGLPLHTDGNESQKSGEARQYGRWLEDVTGIAVEYFDERYTSVEAEQALISAGLTSQKRKARLDKLAAQIMLSAYLEAHSS